MAARVVVMTAGPGRVAAEKPVDGALPRPPGFRATARLPRSGRRARPALLPMRCGGPAQAVA